MDAITTEVLKHRLWEINNEIGILAARMAASPAVYETGDYNTGILTADGKGLFSGVGVIRMATALDLVVQAVMSVFGEDIHPGDVFLTNDPHAGALHQMDVAVVAPVFYEEQLIAWTGIVFHELDMGGPTAGSWSVGATDAYQEPPLVPPVRVVHRDKLVRDVEAYFLRNSRTPDVLGINLHAKIGAQELARARILEIVADIGVEAFVALQEKILEEVRQSVRTRLAAVPDGEWDVNAFLDHDGVQEKVYELRLKATKRGSDLTLDFTGTSKQAPGPINSARSGLIAGLLEVLVPAFCFDVPWSHGAVLDCVKVISEPGTLNNATFPAPTSMATVNGCQSTSDLVWQVVGQMYGWTDQYLEESMALGFSGVNSGVISGWWKGGRRFVLSCSGLGGGAARSYQDGIDSSGNIIAPIFAIPNVERLESLSPILYLHRRERIDTAGPGTYRGGLGVEFAITPHKADGPITGVAFSTGKKQPEARGAFGGLPGSAQTNVILRDADPVSLFSTGELLELRPPEGHFSIEVLEAKSAFTLKPGDVWVSVCTGGGGYGDPLLRDPQRVLADVLETKCAPEDALNTYGVVLEGNEVNAAATEAKRKELRAARLSSAKVRTPSTNGKRDASGAALAQSPVFVAHEGPGEPLLSCKQCGHALGHGAAEAKAALAVKDVQIQDLYVVNWPVGPSTVFVREFYCPSCGTLLSAEALSTESELTDGLIETLWWK